MDKYFYQILGGIELLGMAVYLGMLIWFVIEYTNFSDNNYNPKNDEETLGIEYDFGAVSGILFGLGISSFVIYTLGGILFMIPTKKDGVSGLDNSINHKILLLTTSILTGLFSAVLVANGIVSIDNQRIANKNYDDDQKQTARDNLKYNKVPYLTCGISSLVAGSAGIIVMITLISYFYVMHPKPPPPTPPPPPKVDVVTQPPDFLKRRKLEPSWAETTKIQ